jgi:hypothetical protein
MTDSKPLPDHLDSHIDACADALGFVIRPEWRAAVRANLAVSLAFARQVDAFALPDETEPASLYKA